MLAASSVKHNAMQWSCVRPSVPFFNVNSVRCHFLTLLGRVEHTYHDSPPGGSQRNFCPIITTTDILAIFCLSAI